jgi:predicted RNA-binding protein
MRFWIGVASQEHVKIGELGGFCQLCHGKSTPLKRMKNGDFIIYYSSKKRMNDKEPYQKFTAIGQIKDDLVYQVEMFEGFFPYRKDVDFFESSEYPIIPLINELTFIQNKKQWGYPFRYGHLEISKNDFLLIASCMLNINILNQIKEDINENCK